MTYLSKITQSQENKPGIHAWGDKLLILLEMIKIEHTVFALPFAFMGALLAARGLPTARQAFFILLAMVGARSAAMAFNRLVDQRYDALNPRTANRALPRGLISRRTTIVFIVISVLLFFTAASRLNTLSLKLAPLALGVVFFYSYTKRFTWASHLILGGGLAIAPTAGWIAVRGDIQGLPLMLSLAVLLWVAGFDILYSLQDEDFDRKLGLHSLPCRLGTSQAMRLAAWLHVSAGLGFMLVGWWADLGLFYWGAAVLAAILLMVEHALLSPRDLTRLNHAFFTLNGLVGIILGVATLFSVWP
jgi:4-hydroxybenzoate polyprenyltransferase